MSGKQILVVEDDPKIAETLVHVLNEQGFEATRVATILEAREVLKLNSFLAIVLDVGLPDGNGFEFCKELRKTNEIPVLFLTALNDEVDKIVGLEIGADDYVTKPFSPREVSARLKAIIKRVKEPIQVNPNIQFKVDEEKKKITYKDQLIETRPIEYEILKLLVKRPGRVFSRDEIIDYCWPDEPNMDSNRTVDTHIKTIRKKIGDIDPQIDPKSILKTSSKVGFYLDA
jgi:two-component system, OmpR family, catabolic regulation response regulator CreB